VTATLRAATVEDVPALTALQRRYDVAWFGAPEHDEDEVREEFALAEAVCVVEADGRVLGAGSRSRTSSSLVVDPAGDADAALGLLVPWLVAGGAAETDVLDRDARVRSALEAAAWRHVRSGFELTRQVSSEWTPAAPDWPAGVEVRPFVPDDANRIHTLVYMDAQWAEVPGHHGREFDEWQRIFLDGREDSEAPVVAWRGDRLVGAAIGRIFSDGTGWVGQLAVARDERGRGVGRALLLEAMRRHLAAGATTLGLGVMAENRGALRLYQGVGLEIEREWQFYAPAGAAG
jgi:ribosomal protein S18 acetylase RimI-like enzyme